MISRIFIYPWVQARLRKGPLGPYLDGFVAEEMTRGYERSTLRCHVWLLADFSLWLARRGLRARDVDETEVDRFIRYRVRTRRKHIFGNVATSFLAYLRAAGVAHARMVKPPTAEDIVLSAFDDHLRQEKQIAPSTRANYARVARQFLQTTSVKSLPRLTADDVAGFVLREAQRHPLSAQFTTTGLRSFLRYLYLRDVLKADLTGAIPAVASRRFEQLPAFLSVGEVRRLLAATTTAMGRSVRDRAILLLLVRLGLRAGEVASLTLDDVDWERAEIFVHGKSGGHKLPLPRDVGACIARYLRHERPRCATRRLFVRCRAPHEGFTHAESVGCVVDRALGHARLNPLHRGAHLLRHTAATQMLRRAASLSEIGQALRHRLVDTTAIYAHVDVRALRHVVVPWPRGGRP